MSKKGRKLAKEKAKIKKKQVWRLKMLPKGLIDSCNFVSIYMEEPGYQKVIYSLNLLKNKDYWLSYISFEVIGEVINSLRGWKKEGALSEINYAIVAEAFIKEIENFELCVSEKRDKKLAVELMNKFNFLTPTDASLLALTKNYGLKNFITTDRFKNNKSELEEELGINIKDIKTL